MASTKTPRSYRSLEKPDARAIAHSSRVRVIEKIEKAYNAMGQFVNYDASHSIRFNRLRSTDPPFPFEVASV
jgi:hypothetical protein